MADKLLSVYEVAKRRGVTEQTVKKAMSAKRPLKVAQEIQVSAGRTVAMFAVKDVDAYPFRTRDTDAALKKAAELLGLTLEEAREMKARADAKRASA